MIKGKYVMCDYNAQKAPKLFLTGLLSCPGPNGGANNQPRPTSRLGSRHRQHLNVGAFNTSLIISNYTLTPHKNGQASQSCDTATWFKQFIACCNQSSFKQI